MHPYGGNVERDNDCLKVWDERSGYSHRWTEVKRTACLVKTC